MRRLATLAAAALLALGAAHASHPDPDPSGFEGAGALMPLVGSAFTLLGAHSAAQALDNLAAAGVRAIRQDFLWKRIEPQPGVYDFASEDSLVDAAASRGIEVVAILAYGNPHYSTAGGLANRIGTGGGVPPFGVGADYLWPPDPEHLPEYRAFARALAEHFRGRVRRYEIWNEPNVGWRFWPPHEDPAAYAALMRAGAEGLRAGDPGAIVSLGGLFYPEVPPGLPEQGALRFLGNMYAADPSAIADGTDAVAWHPYPYPFVAPEVVLPGNSSVPGSADAVRALLAGHGDGSKRLWVTEAGWPTHQEYGVSVERQAAYLARAFALLWAEGVEALVWYTYADGPNAAHNQEDAFGLFDFAGNPKPSYDALDTFTAVLGDDVFEGSRAAELGLRANEHARSFVRPRPGNGAPLERVTMLWTSPERLTTDYGPLADTDARRTLPVPVHGPVTLVSMTGEATRLEPDDDGRVAFEISPFPVYLVEPNG